MKKKYREKVLNEMFSEVQDKDFDVRENAMFQLGLMLERSNSGEGMTDSGDIYADNLSREMLRMRLDDDEQNQVIDQLSRLVAMEVDSRPTALWTMGKAKGELGVAPLLALLQAVGHKLNTEASYQACDALRRWLKDGLLNDDEIAKQVKLHDPSDLLDKWVNSSDARLATGADALLDLLEG